MNLHDLQSVKNHLLAIGCKIEDAEAGFTSKNIISLHDEIEEQACDFLQAIDELDDVQSVYTNMA